MSRQRNWIIMIGALLSCSCGGNDKVADPADTGAGGCLDSHPSISSGSGCIEGTDDGAVEAFLGIPYAQPPVGELRWRRTVPVDAWSDPFDASVIGSLCPQGENPLPVGVELGEGSEDCLTLNILRPSGTQPGDDLPILFFTHGGGYAFGGGGVPTYVGDGETHAPLGKSAILVTHNYRLGPLGFAAHPALSAESDDDTSGNYGLYDSLAALQWVNDNAEALGGTVDELLIHGESAGSMTTCSLMASPLADGLFTGAILQSGLCTEEQPLRDTTDLFDESAEEEGEALAAALGCDTEADVLACMRAISASDILQSQDMSVSGMDTDGVRYWPIIDGTFLTETTAQSIRDGKFNKVPVVIGINRDEGNLHGVLFGVTTWAGVDAYLRIVAWAFGFDSDARSKYVSYYTEDDFEVPARAMGQAYTDLTFSCIGRLEARWFAEHVDTRAYWFAKNSDVIDAYYRDAIGYDMGAYHGAELSYVFGTVNDSVMYDDEDEALSEQMRQMWASAAAGAWQLPDGSDWPLVDEANWVELRNEATVLESEEAMRDAGFRIEVCDFLEAEGVWDR